MDISNDYLLSPDEVNQSKVRFTNTSLILSYLILCAYINHETIFVAYVLPALVYFFLTILLYLWSHRCVKLPENDHERILFRILGLTGDLVCLTVVMILANDSGTPLYFVYLWIIVGNGIRYGILYLIISTLISLAGFTFVVVAAPAWHNAQLMPIAIGLYISLLIFPVYILNLISRLTAALKSEKIANQVKNTFLANMNHELRTPLNSIISLVELMHAYNLPVKLHKLLGMIRTSASSQMQIVNSILDFSKIEAGQYHLEKISFDIYELIFDVTQILIPQANQKGLLFQYHIDSSVAQYYVGSSDQIKQILINLGGNAIKFTEKGYVNITVRSSLILNDSQELEFIIKDTGIGIPEHFQHEIFKPFTQADTSITRKYGGTGLGLPIANEMVRLMGGSLSFNTIIDFGTEFIFKVVLEQDGKKKVEMPLNIKVYALGFPDKNREIIDTLSKLGVDVIQIKDPDTNLLKQLMNNERSVVLTYDQEHDEVNDAINNVINDPEIVSITINSTCQKIDKNCKSITSVSYSPTVAEVINALNIVNKYLPKDINPRVVLPKYTRTLNILLAEDDPVIREIHNITFINAGHNIKIVKDGIEALKSLEENYYDMAILDLYMPGLSGVEVIKNLNEDKVGFGTKIIILTADTNVESYRNQLAGRSVSILNKSIGPSGLLNIIDKSFSGAADSIDWKNTFVLGHDGVGDNYECISTDIINENILFLKFPEYLNLIDVYNREVLMQIKIIKENISLDKTTVYYSALHRIKGASVSFGSVAFTNIIDLLINTKIEVSNYEMVLSVLDNLKNIHDLSIIGVKHYLLSIRERGAEKREQ